jgi:hypothetical protein
MSPPRPRGPKAAVIDRVAPDHVRTSYTAGAHSASAHRAQISPARDWPDVIVLAGESIDVSDRFRWTCTDLDGEGVRRG